MQKVDYAKQTRNPATIDKANEALKKSLDGMIGKKVEGNGLFKSVTRDKDTATVEVTVGSVTVKCHGANNALLSRLKAGTALKISGVIQEFKGKEFKTVGKGVAARKVQVQPDTIVVKDCTFGKPTAR
jgi:hypothetical protein